MRVVWRLTPRSLISGVSAHQRHQRPSNRQMPNNYRLVLGNFGEGLEIARPLTPLNTLKPLMNNNFFVAAATTMMVVWRMDSTLFDQRRQRSSAASAAQQSPNAQQLPIGSREFRRGLEIERPLTPLIAPK